jgi:hypothetical protein
MCRQAQGADDNSAATVRSRFRVGSYLIHAADAATRLVAL